MKDKILIFFDMDIVIRAFYQSKTFEELERNYQVEYVFPFDNTSQKKYINIDFEMFENKKIHFVKIKRERMGFWYHLFIAQLLLSHYHGFCAADRGITYSYAVRITRIRRPAVCP